VGRFRGLFIGIDKYASPDISELRCAERDARALQALFADTLGDGGKLVCGPDATRVAIEAYFSELAGSDIDDVVVIAFSGHGSETHQLVTHDADPQDLENTAVPLDLLLEWFKRIPARRMICVLDCCFSGALGAKVLQADIRPRALRSTAALLSEIAGDGRLILTASAEDEAAWENQRIGHGLLTHYLLQALQGAEEVRADGKVSVLRLLEYVIQRVTNDAEHLGQKQRPTIRGTIDGDLTWPVFIPGEQYAVAFPERAHAPVTGAVESLGSHGFRPEVLAAWAGSIPSLNRLQLEAINDFGVLGGEHMLVSAPTSSGKTMIGELAALSNVEAGRRALFLLPMKALVNDKHQEFERKYGAAGVRTIRATGDYSDQVGALLRGQYEIALLTYEKCAGLVLAQPHILDQVGAVIVDEIQMLADEGRGAGLEFLMTLLRVRRRYGASPQVVALSAVIGETNGLEHWLSGRLLRRNERPIPLDEGVLGPDGGFSFRADDGTEHEEPFIQREFRGRSARQELIVPLVRRLVSEGKQVIVFRETRGETVGTAGYLSSDLQLAPADSALTALPSGDLSVASQTLRGTLANGVAFHNSDLSRGERSAIEAELRNPDSKVRVVVATTTLAMGINTGAEAVVIAGLTHPGRPPKPYTVAEYKNMVGRAGRLGFSERGTSFLVAADGATAGQFWSQYVNGQPEDLHSRFLEPGTDPRGQILRVLAASAGMNSGETFGMTSDEIVAFLEESFGAFQQRRRHDQWAWDSVSLHRAVAELAQNGLIEEIADNRYQLTALGTLAAESGHEVESVIRLVATLRRINPASLSAETLIAATQVTVELDQVWVPMHPRSGMEPQRWFGFLQSRGVPGEVTATLRQIRVDTRGATLRAKRASTCIMWMSATERQEIEATLTRHVRENTAAGQISQTASRTADLLPLTCGIAELLYEGLDLGDIRDRLLLRLEIGLPDELVPIAELVGNQLTRGHYLALARSGLVTREAIRAANDDTLAVVFGSNLALRDRLRDALGIEPEGEQSIDRTASV
jgi:replicative superfamily II helicase